MFITPSRLPVHTQEAIRRTASQVARAIGLRHGPVHAEMRVNEDGVWPLEMAPRSIGGLCSRLFRFRTGLTLEEVILLHATGEPLDKLADPSAASGALMIPIPRSGSLVAVEGVDEALAVPAIEDVVISLRPGQEVVPLPEGNRYLGFIFARSEEGPEAVEAALREAHGRLSVTIE